MMSLLCSVLVVDDEAALRKVIRASLSENGFDVDEVGTGEEALLAIGRRPFDLVLLDINMPGLNGIDVCRQLRSSAPRTGIVMVTVHDAEEDKIHALEAGADDYVTKPFQFRELVARLRAVLRRTRANGIPQPKVFNVGGLKIDTDRRIVWKDGDELHLSPKEFDLLAYMVRNSGAPLTHVNLLRAVWGAEYGDELEYLRTYVRMLRKKIEDDPTRPQYILTEPWVGYRFRNPADSDKPGEKSKAG